MTSLHKSRRTLKQALRIFRKKGAKLSENEKKSFENKLFALDNAIVARRKKEAALQAKQVSACLKEHFPKTFFDHAKELVYALIFALVIAFAIRTVWFELYEVPTGSMRPTIEEQDRLIVSKSTFGVHLPFTRGLLFFKPEYIKRGGIIVFTTDEMDIPDNRMLYFYLFPGKKRFIKRAIGKGGDTLYFYGGRVYGIDADGQTIPELADEATLQKMRIASIDHVPVITFEGKMIPSDPLSDGSYQKATIRQMNEPIGRISAKPYGGFQGEFFDGKAWHKDRPNALKKAHKSPQSYSDLWGIGHFAMSRILSQEEMGIFYPSEEASKERGLYLELKHTPNFTYPTPKMRRDLRGNTLPSLTSMTTFIPLGKEHIKSLFENLYTARFCVKQGRAWRYHESKKWAQNPLFDVNLSGVPDGCYEFQDGKGYKVGFGGILRNLPSDHPLYKRSDERLKQLFNLGISFNTLFRPFAKDSPFAPQRFAYFRDGALFVMGAPIFKKEDPALVNFVQAEEAKQEASSAAHPYIAFIDRGPPLKDGVLNTEFIKAFGLKVPKGYILALGDNYANSGDSREFGFVPEINLRGSPLFTFWPPGSRWGRLVGARYPVWTLPNLLVWGLGLLIMITLVLYYNCRRYRSLMKKKNKG